MGNRSMALSEAVSRPPLSIVESKDVLVSLTKLCDLVVLCERSYEDMASAIEMNAYELCNSGNNDQAIEQLGRIAYMFEHMVDKNEEQCRDLADIYLLIGQIHQFAGHYVDSIVWFSRSAIADDRYPEPFHSLADSFSRLREYDDAIRSLEQEIALAPGNYYSYLLLADLYEKEGRPEDVEYYLKQLLDRDPDNIQGLHSLIRHYRRSGKDIDTTLIRRRLMGVVKPYSRSEAIIRSWYMCVDGRHAEALDFIEPWHTQAGGSTVTCLVKAYLFHKLRRTGGCRKMLEEFCSRNRNNTEAMAGALREFTVLFDNAAAKYLCRQLNIDLSCA